MGMVQYTWSAAEKKTARAAFRKAHDKEMAQIRAAVLEMAKTLRDKNDIWRLHEYLAMKREEMECKYYYRYSMLLIVFAELIREDLISIEDLAGLSEDKITAITQTLVVLRDLPMVRS